MTFSELRSRQDVPVVVINALGEFVYVNKCFCEVFGFSHDQVIGQPLVMIIPVNLRDAHNMGMSRFLTSEKPMLMNKPLHLKAIDSHGKEFTAEHFIMAEKIEGKWQFAASIVPLN